MNSSFLTISEKEREDMRKELSSYISECRLDSEGRPLVQIPSNFNQVVTAMNRDDLFSSEEKPWSKYLLQSSVPIESLFSDQDSISRYKDIANDEAPDNKIKKGLAEIYMLDRQLEDVNHKEKIIAKISADRTFLTKVLNESDYASEPSTSRQASSRVDEKGKSSPSATEAIQQKKASHIVNIEPKLKRNGLSSEDEKRVQQLLESDDFQEADYLSEYKHENEIIDQQLCRYGRMDRLKSADAERAPERRRNQRPEDEEGDFEKKDYLAEQVSQSLLISSLRGLVQTIPFSLRCLRGKSG